MWKVKKWFGEKTASKKEYEQEKREFIMAIGKPFITLKIGLPNGFDDQRYAFLKKQMNKLVHSKKMEKEKTKQSK